MVKTYAPGFGLIGVLVAIAFQINNMQSAISPLALCVAFGFLVANFAQWPAFAAPATKVSSKTIMRIGVALLGAYGKTSGLLGGVLDSLFGIQLTYSLWGVIIAETFVALPFLILALEGGLRSIDTKYEEAAAVMGAKDLTRFTRVTLPLLKPSLSGHRPAIVRKSEVFPIPFAPNTPTISLPTSSENRRANSPTATVPCNEIIAMLRRSSDHANPRAHLRK